MSLLEHLQAASRSPSAPGSTGRSNGVPAGGPPTAAPPSEIRRPTVAPPRTETPRPRLTVRNEALTELKARVHEELIHELDPEQLADDISFTSPARRAVEQAAEERIAQIDGVLGRQDRLRLASEIADEVLGF